MIRKILRLIVFAMLVMLVRGGALAQSCTTQSQMSAAERDGLRQAALLLAGKMQAGDVAGVRVMAVAGLAQQGGGAGSDADVLGGMIADTAPHLKQAKFIVESVWLFHAEDSTKAAPADGTKSGDGPGLVDFYCALPGEADATFTLRITAAAKYAVAIVEATGVAAPWQMSFVLQEADGAWKLSDVTAKPLTAAGHDGLWYWTAGRAAAKAGEKWTAWLYLTRADLLLTPMNSLASSNRDKLHGEIAALGLEAPTLQKPLVIDGAASGEKYSITALGTDDAFGGLDVVVHVAAMDVSNAVEARKRNIAVMQAVLTAWPELRSNFHGLWVFADAPGQAPYAIEQSMAQIQDAKIQDAK